MSEPFSNSEPGTVVQPCQESVPQHWIEIELVGEDDNPIPWEEYEVTLPGGETVRGYLDEDGWARVEGIARPGGCRVTFPRLDQEAWDKHQDAVAGPRPRVQPPV